MNKNLNLKRSIAVGSLLLFALLAWACGPSATNNTGGNKNAGPTNANKAAEKLVACDDGVVIKEMQATIEAKYPALKTRMDQLSAYSKDCSVSLLGYTDTLQNFKDFYAVAAGTPNVVKVDIDKLFISSADVQQPSPGGECPVGQQACGEICVPQGQCWTKNKMEANTNTNTNTNANTNAKSNAAAKP